MAEAVNYLHFSVALSPARHRFLPQNIVPFTRHAAVASLHTHFPAVERESHTDKTTARLRFSTHPAGTVSAGYAEAQALFVRSGAHLPMAYCCMIQHSVSEVTTPRETCTRVLGEFRKFGLFSETKKIYSFFESVDTTHAVQSNCFVHSCSAEPKVVTRCPRLHAPKN